jgi:hypothetical protein
MKIFPLKAVATAAVVAFSGSSALSAPVSITVSGVFTDAPDSITVGPNILSSLVGLAFTSTFAYDTAGATINDAFNSPADGGTREELSTEFTGGFASPSVPGAGSYVSPTLVAEMENNVTRDSAELLGLSPPGTYDLFSVNGWQPGSTFSGGSTIGDGGAIDGVNFGLTFIGDGSSALIGTLTASDSMPTALDLNLVTGVIVTIEEFAGGELVGFAYQFGQINEGGTFENFTIVSGETPAVSAPGVATILGLAFGAMAIRRRGRTA